MTFFQSVSQFIHSLSRVRLFVTPWITACQASLSITNSRSSLKLLSIELVIPSSHLILCRPFLLLPPIPPSIRDFSNESTLRMRWPKYWSFSFRSQVSLCGLLPQCMQSTMPHTSCGIMRFWWVVCTLLLLCFWVFPQLRDLPVVLLV